MDDQRTDSASGGGVLRRILKWLAIAAWAYTIFAVAATWILAKRGDSLGYSACAEAAVISANAALVPSCLYLLVIVVNKWFPRDRK